MELERSTYMIETLQDCRFFQRSWSRLWLTKLLNSNKLARARVHSFVDCAESAAPDFLVETVRMGPLRLCAGLGYRVQDKLVEGRHRLSELGSKASQEGLMECFMAGVVEEEKLDSESIHVDGDFVLGMKSSRRPEPQFLVIR